MEHTNGKIANTTNAIVGFIKDVGFPITVAVYFFIKDWFFTQEQIELQTRIAVTLERITFLLSK